MYLLQIGQGGGGRANLLLPLLISVILLPQPRDQGFNLFHYNEEIRKVYSSSQIKEQIKKQTLTLSSIHLLQRRESSNIN